MNALLDVLDLETARLGPLSLRLAVGELVQVTGASGSGKSLLLRALADLDASRGLVRLGDCDRDRIAPGDWRRQVAYVPAETAWWAPRVDGNFPPGWRLHDAKSWLACFALPDDALDWEIERLSSGERQRLGLLRALLNRPRVLLLDEPTANLDRENTQRLEAAVRRYLAEHGAGAIWVSHDRLQQDRLGGRVLEIHDGRLRS
ncbi:ATP-binding cassette domain-containing protein [Thioalkalicoccus limnaeus]|uniref:ATP-binding cassette domain-containing protein n=1 Tax=Thioalkalicoccus limnaeus TaxID=120681 RepID=A0ABV4BER8_9GAMM